LTLITIFFKKYLKIYCNRFFIIFLALGFCSGVPFLLTLSTLSFWLSESGASKTVIGFFSIATLPYGLKIFWAPFLESIKIPFLTKIFGVKKACGIASQILLILSIILLGQINPVSNFAFAVIISFMISFFASTQDIIVDAIRIDISCDNHLGVNAAAESIGFRLGMFASGAGTLYFSAIYSWSLAYSITGILCFVGIIAFILIPDIILDKNNQDPKKNDPLKEKNNFSKWLKLKIKDPLQAIFNHGSFFYIVAFIFFLKFGDIVMNAMSPAFFHDLGFTKIEYANISKFFGIFLMIVGSIVGSVMITRLGLFQSLVTSAFLQSICCLLFWIQSVVGHKISVMIITIGTESFVAGIIATLFISYISKLCRGKFSGTKFTVLYSIGSLARILISVMSGYLADNFGWKTLFIIASLTFFPTLWLTIKLDFLEKQKK
jgi:MFS transporter, PAT family, beta-lactamase induction signal transducer AmpG